MAGVKDAKMISRDVKTQERRTQPGWFEDSFSLKTKPGWFEASSSLNFAFPGHHFGGAQGCQNDAQGTQRVTNEKKDDFLELFAHPFGSLF